MFVMILSEAGEGAVQKGCLTHALLYCRVTEGQTITWGHASRVLKCSSLLVQKFFFWEHVIAEK